MGSLPNATAVLRVSTPKRNETPFLCAGWNDFAIRTLAQTRNICGNLCEDLTASLTGGVRLATDSRCDICPDLLHKGTEDYFEVKSCGKNGSGIIYQVIWEKQRRFVEQGGKLCYWFWQHKAECKSLAYASDVRSALFNSLQWVACIEFQALAEILASREKRTICTPGKNTTNYARNGYGVGWSFPTARVRERLAGPITVSVSSFQTTTQIPFYGTTRFLKTGLFPCK
jgi:hypothetical protein